MYKYNIRKQILNNVQYNFATPRPETLQVTIQDDISIVEINENKATLSVSRKMQFDRDGDTYIKTNYEVGLECNELINKKELQNAIINKHINLAIVFSKISLIISNITSMTPFGAIVTPPSYDLKPANEKK